MFSWNDKRTDQVLLTVANIRNKKASLPSLESLCFHTDGDMRTQFSMCTNILKGYVKDDVICSYQELLYITFCGLLMNLSNESL